MAGRNTYRPPKACVDQGWNRNCRVAHVQAYLPHTPTRPGHDPGSPKGTATPCRHPDHTEYLHPGYIRREAGSGIKAGRHAMEDVSMVRIGTFRETALGAKPFAVLVGAPGFEPGTSCAQGKRATRLRHAPNGCQESFCQAWRIVSSLFQRSMCFRLRVKPPFRTRCPHADVAFEGQTLRGISAKWKSFGGSRFCLNWVDPDAKPQQRSHDGQRGS